MNINDKRIVITGAASGIGEALLRQLNRFRCQIMAVDRNPITAVDYNTQKAQVTSLRADLSSEAGNEAVFSAAVEQMNGVDIFIANAGFAHYGHANTLNWEDMSAQFQVNVFAPLYAATRMAEMNPTQPYLIAITASAQAKLAVPGYAHYAATKAALDRFAEAYRYEIASNGQLLMVYPISTRTHFFQQKAQDSAPVPYPVQTADYVARRIITGITKDRKTVNPSPGFLLYWTLVRLFPLLGNIYKRYGANQLTDWVRKSD